MADFGNATAGTPARKRGRPLQIDRSRILEVAKGLDPQTLTMQAVADELGVDRKAINYHVTDRDGLLRLVAADVFESRFADTFTAEVLGSDGDWRATVRAWAMAIRDGMVATGVATMYYRIDTDNPAIFEPVELVLRRLVEAGFGREVASRALIFVTRLAMGVGRDTVMEKQMGEHPQGPEVRRVLSEGAAQGDYEELRWLVSADLNGPDDIDTQFAFELDFFIAGMERLLLTATDQGTE
ncbi:TetR/AcrR family transcriptional regulator C-terminal domain-containing protein [Leifsonia lichenia]